MRRLSSLASDLAQTAGGYVFEWLAAAARPVPMPIRLPLVSAMGFLFGRAALGMRAALQTNLSALFNIEGRRLVRATDEIFRNFALTLHDFFFPEGITISVPGREELEALRQKHGGV